MLMRMLRERRITVMDIAFVEVRDVLEGIQKYVREQYEALVGNSNAPAFLGCETSFQPLSS